MGFLPQRRIIIIDVHKGTKNVLVVQVVEDDATEGDFCPDTAVNDTSSALDLDVQSGCLLNFNHLFAYLPYDTIERMSSFSISGIRITAKSRPPCLTCAQGLQRRNN